MAESINQSGITVTSTTQDPKSITVPDVDYIYLLAIKDLTQAIKELTTAYRSR